MSFSHSLKSKAEKVWEDGYNHPFVQGLGSGTLDREKFKFYLMQDYHYLIGYAKVFALAAIKAEDEILMTRCSTIQYNILAKEMDLHRSYMADYNVSPQILRDVKSSLFNRAYVSNMIAIGQTGDLAGIIAAVFPCAWTYSDYASRLKKQYAHCLEGNYYKSWIEKYAGDEFLESYQWFYDTLDELVKNKSDKEMRAIEDIFVSSVEFEYLFWDMAYNKQMSYSPNLNA